MTDPNLVNVLIVGTYSGLNKGDRLMQQIASRAIVQYGGRPIIASPFPKIDRDIYPGITITKARRRNLPLSLVQCFVLWALPKGLRRRFAESNVELKYFAHADLVVDTSGDMLTEDYGPHVALSHLFPLLYCKLLDKKLLVLAQSIGPFRLLGRVFDKVLQHAEVVNVRDQITFRYLQARKISGLTQVADLGFLLQPQEIDSASLFGSIEKPDVRLVGICPSALFFDKFATDKSKVSVVEFCRLLDETAELHKLAYVLLPHVMTPSGAFDDLAFCNLLVAELDTDCIVADPKLEPAEIKYLVSKLCAVVTFRMHGAIAALDTFTPTIAVSYSHKTDGLFEMLELSEWVVGNDDALITNLGEKLTSLLAQCDDVSQHLRERIPILREQAKINLTSIHEAMS